MSEQPATAAIGTSAIGTYRPGLDGLRAVAVVGVVLYHAGATSSLSGLAPGGFIGVSVFFTLSGYLVTSLLLRRFVDPAGLDRDGLDRDGLDMSRFWARRLKRLAPASLVVVLACVLLAPFFWSGMLATDALAGTFGYTNWYVIWTAPDALLRTIVGPLGPFWSLAVEEQFYLLASLAVLIAARTARPIRTLSVFIGVGWCASLAAQLLADWPQYEMEFSTLTRAAELLAGSALAIVLLHHPDLPARWARPLQPIGVIAFVTIIALMASTDYDPPWLLHGGYAALSIVSAALVLSLLTPGLLTQMLAWRPAVRIGRLSYSWYLVHWPVILILTPDRTGLDRWPLVAVKVTSSLVVALALHHLVEQPLRNADPPTRTVVLAWLTGSVTVAVAALVLL